MPNVENTRQKRDRFLSEFCTLYAAKLPYASAVWRHVATFGISFGQSVVTFQ